MERRFDKTFSARAGHARDKIRERRLAGELFSMSIILFNPELLHYRQ